MKNGLVVKDNALMNASYNLEVTEQRLILLAIISAREFEIAFPSELNAEQRENMLNELCRNLVKKYGVIVDAAIHA
uniref:MobA/MobL family protein n=1 Tax=Acinetobacter soli TaxID=487316 RepID=UPI00209187DE